jgi:tetratricopeptide (TPR) repeat protein
VLLGLVAVGAAEANERSQALRREGYEASGNLDYGRAAELFNQAIAADPADAAAYRAAASVDWLQILFARGTLLVDDYLHHFRSSTDPRMPQPPPALVASFQQHIQRSIALGEQEVGRRYSDAASHYDLGSALGLEASFAATVEGRLYAAGRSARRAFAENELALKLDPGRKDAGLVVGTYRYLVSSLPAAVRVMALLLGFGGDRALAIRLLQDAAAFPSDVQSDARFGLVLVYNREHRYADALDVIHGLERSCPRNRLLVLEEGATALRADRAREAESVLDDGISRLAQDHRPRMPGEEGRWYFERGEARLRLGKVADAEKDLRAALDAPGVRGWVLARIHVDLGKVADLRGDRTTAKAEYGTALSLTSMVPDATAEAEATRFLAQPYRQ